MQSGPFPVPFIFSTMADHPPAIVPPHPQFEDQPDDSSSPIDPDTTDALIEVVSQQIELLTFDPDDCSLMQQMVEGFGDRRNAVQLRLVELFGEIGEEATPILVEALTSHVNPVVRRACAKALAKLGDADAIPALIHALLQDPDPITKSSASGALARMGEAAVPALLGVIASPSYPDDQKGQATWALSCLGADAAEQLYAAIDSDNPDVRSAVVGAIATLAKTQPPTAVDARSEALNLLLEALQDSAVTVRQEAVSGLGKLSTYNATPELIPLLQDPDPDVRKTTALVLGGLRDPSALDALNALLEDPSDVVRPVVTWAIQQLKSQKLGLAGDRDTP